MPRIPNSPLEEKMPKNNLSVETHIANPDKPLFCRDSSSFSDWNQLKHNKKGGDWTPIYNFHFYSNNKFLRGGSQKTGRNDFYLFCDGNNSQTKNNLVME